MEPYHIKHYCRISFKIFLSQRDVWLAPLRTIPRKGKPGVR